MLTNPTVDTLRKLRLSEMADAFLRQMQDSSMSELTFDERFSLLVDHQWTARRNRQLNRLIRAADLREQASPENIDFQTNRGLDRSLVKQLLTGQWITSNHNVLITGPTGIGKTYLVCALAVAACRQDFHVRYYRMSRLFQDIYLAKADGSYGKLAASLTAVDLLILDDWGLAPLNAPESRELLDILDDRVSNKSTCLASQLPVDLWHKHFTDPTLADAILDRIVHRAYRIKMDGESMRKLRSSLPNDNKSGM